MGTQNEVRAERESLSLRREAFWRQHLERWRTQGSSQRDYCRQHGLGQGSFSRWKYELARREETTRRSPDQQVSPPFIPLQFVARSESPSICEVVLRNGRRLRLGAACEPDWIAQVAKALEDRLPC